MRRLCSCAMLALLFGCTPGELTDEEKDALERELERRYGEDDDSANDDSANDAGLSDDSANDAGPSDDSANDDSASDAGPSDDAANDDDSADDAEPSDDATSDDSTDEPSSADDAAPPASGQIDACVLTVFERSCAGIGCHYGNAVNSPPNLESVDLFDFLTTEGPAACSSATTNYVDLATPEQSYLLLKIRGEQPAGCGSRMPSIGTLSADQLQCLEDWFASL